MSGLSARLFVPTVKAVCWNIDFNQRALPAAIYSWETYACVGKLP